MALVWKNNPVDVYERIRASYEQRVINTVQSILDGMTDEMTDWMKAYAPWTNQTYLARLTLWAQTILRGQVFTLGFGYGTDVFYGIFLETMSMGEFAIVAPAVDKFSIELMYRLQKAGFKVKRGVSVAGRARSGRAGLPAGSTRHGRTVRRWAGMNQPGQE